MKRGKAQLRFMTVLFLYNNTGNLSHGRSSILCPFFSQGKSSDRQGDRIGLVMGEQILMLSPKDSWNLSMCIHIGETLPWSVAVLQKGKQSSQPFPSRKVGKTARHWHYMVDGGRYDLVSFVFQGPGRFLWPSEPERHLVGIVVK